MEELTSIDIELLLTDLASRAGTAAQIAGWYGMTRAQLDTFVEANRGTLEAYRERITLKDDKSDIDQVTPTQLDELWIANKFERLLRVQTVADKLYFEACLAPDAVTVRELRAYLAHAANELGQLLHRGSGEAGTGDTLSVDIQGVDMETLR